MRELLLEIFENAYKTAKEYAEKYADYKFLKTAFVDNQLGVISGAWRLAYQIDITIYAEMVQVYDEYYYAINDLLL